MPFTIPFICMVISFFVGYFGRNKRMGFWGYFFASLLLTPFVGVLLVIVSDEKKKEDDDDDDKKEAAKK